MASPIRLDPNLLAAAEREGAVNKRSIPKQIEFWAELGKAVENVMGMEDVIAVAHGIKKIRLETLESKVVDHGDIFADLEERREKGSLSENVTSAAFIYEASMDKPGFLDRIDSKTGLRISGKFTNGEFKKL